MKKKIDNNYGDDITIKIINRTILFSFKTKKNIDVVELYAKSKFSNEIVYFDLNKKGKIYTFKIECNQIEKLKTVEISEGILILNKLSRLNDKEKLNYFDLYIRLQTNDVSIGEIQDVNSNKQASYFFGGFKTINYQNDNSLSSFNIDCDNSNNYKIGVNCKEDSYFDQFIKEIKLNNNRLKIVGNVKSNVKIINLNLYIKGRDTFSIYDIPAKIQKVQIIDVNTYKIYYIVEFDLNNIVDDNFIPDTYGIYIKVIDDKKEEYAFRQKRLKLLQRIKIKRQNIFTNNKVFSFSPIFSFKGKLLSMQVDDFKKDNFLYLMKKIKTRQIDRFINRKRDIWLISERIYKAQDNGYFLFKYMRENYPDKEVYYIIDENSKELANIKNLGNVVYFKSKKHIELVLLANKFISTHHYEYMLPLRDKKFKRKLKGANIFLQHGVMGTKYMANLYADNLSSFRADSFIVSSEKEKGYIVSDFLFSEDKVFVTGLARYDNLFSEKFRKKQIAIIPTWRDWLQNVDIFLESDYFKRYQNLINNTDLLKMCIKENIELIFCLHPNMQQYTKFFENNYVNVISQGDVDVQSILKESSMLITDYSSVGFDFSFLEKPLLYYMFDREDFFGKDGSHLNIDIDLPGRIIYNEDVLVDEINTYIKNDFIMKDKYLLRANDFIKYKDTNNCLRIKKVIESTKKDKSIKNKFKKLAILKLVANVLRSNKLYIPIMKRLVKIIRLLPLQKDFIVFESNMGKSFSDSPKALYEEICQKYPNMFKIVVCDITTPGLSNNTKRIKRLSFSYFYYVSVSKYLINNQNFANYIKRRKDMVIIQTWHGTPIKKMFYDLENITGRDSGYKKRVSEAIKQWSYLISPNTYSTMHFKSAFKHNAKVIELGYPRNDVLYNKNNQGYISDIKDKLGIYSNKKIVLYAPTFRDDNNIARNKFKHDLNLDLDKLYSIVNDDVIILIRYHLVISSELDIPSQYNDKIKNISTYENVEDLLLISDMLITDYSSIFFDYLNLERPIVFYAYDLKKYQDELRGFYLDYNNDNLPGPIVKNEIELYQKINELDNIKKHYYKKIIECKSKYCNSDGNASKKIVEKIFK